MKTCLPLSREIYVPVGTGENPQQVRRDFRCLCCSAWPWPLRLPLTWGPGLLCPLTVQLLPPWASAPDHRAAPAHGSLLFLFNLMSFHILKASFLWLSYYTPVRKSSKIQRNPLPTVNIWLWFAYWSCPWFSPRSLFFSTPLSFPFLVYSFLPHHFLYSHSLWHHEEYIFGLFWPPFLAHISWNPTLWWVFVCLFVCLFLVANKMTCDWGPGEPQDGDWSPGETMWPRVRTSAPHQTSGEGRGIGVELTTSGHWFDQSCLVTRPPCKSPGYGVWGVSSLAEVLGERWTQRVGLRALHPSPVSCSVFLSIQLFLIIYK